MPENTPTPLSAEITAADAAYAGLHLGISGALAPGATFFTRIPDQLAGLDALTSGANADAADWERALVSSNTSYLVGSAFGALATGPMQAGVMASTGAWIGSKIGDWIYDNSLTISGDLADFGESLGQLLQSVMTSLETALAAGLQAFDDALADLGDQLDALMPGIGDSMDESREQVWDWSGNPFESPPVSPSSSTWTMTASSSCRSSAPRPISIWTLMVSAS